MDIELIIEYLPLFIQGLWTTLWIVAISIVIGGAIAIPLALVRVYNVPVLSTFSKIYSYIFRGTPLLIQIYLIYFGLSQFEAVRESWAWWFLSEPKYCLLMGFSLNTSAYISEIIRGAIQSVSQGEIEAARASGMSELQVIQNVILPGAFCRAIPPLSNEFIFLVHSSVIASTITIVDILGAGRELNASYYVVLEGLLTAAAFYLVLVLLLTLFSRFLERKYTAFLR